MPKFYSDIGTGGDFEVTSAGDITLDAAGEILLETADGDIRADANNYFFSSSGNGSPVVNISNGNANSIAPSLKFNKTATDGADSDFIGQIDFVANNLFLSGSNVAHTFAKMFGMIGDASSGDETGKLMLQVKTNLGPSLNMSVLRSGLFLEGGNDQGFGAGNDTINATLGFGAASVTNIAGNLLVNTGFTLGGHLVNDIDVAGEFVDSDEHLMTSAAINDRIAAAGGSVSVSDSAANTDFPVVFHNNSNGLLDDTGAFTYNPSTGTAAIPIASIPTRKFAIPADGAGNVDGDVVYIGTNTGGTATVAGKIYYYHASGLWVLTNSDAPASATGFIAVALGTDPDVDGMLVRGTVDLATNIVGTEAIGSILYLDKVTTGTATTVAPTSEGDIVRVIGYALTTGNANKIWFSPDNTWVEHT
jgi:hypothetical protein